MLLATPVGELPRFLGGPVGGQIGYGGQSLQTDRYTWLSGLGATGSKCRLDAKTVKGSDGSIWPDSQSTYPSCNLSEKYQALQQALTALAAATGNAGFDPGATDGMLVDGLPSTRVMSAVIQAMPYLKPKLGTALTAILTIALAVGSTTTTAKQAVKDYMGPIAVAVATIAALKGGGGSSGSALVAAETTPWYKTWWGAGGLAIGAIGIIYLITQRRAA
jgi:hypothetical protein